MIFWRIPIAWVLSLLIFFALSPFVHAAEKSSELSEYLKNNRFSATLPYVPPLSSQDAAILAEAAANQEARQQFMRYLVTLPEVRLAGGDSSRSSQMPDLPALAKATGRTVPLIVNHSKKFSTVTVTVAFLTDDASVLEARVREALLHPARLERYKDVLQRETALLKKYKDLAVADSSSQGPEAMEIVNEVRSLNMLTELLPSWDGLWEDPAAVITDLHKALLLMPESPLLRNALGDAFLQLGRSHEALEEQSAALKVDPGFARAYHSRGAASLALGHQSSAVADFSEAIRLSPETPLYHRDRGLARHLLGETAAMCIDLREACALGECRELQWAVGEKYCTP